MPTQLELFDPPEAPPTEGVARCVCGATFRGPSCPRCKRDRYAPVQPKQPVMPTALCSSCRLPFPVSVMSEGRCPHCGLFPACKVCGEKMPEGARLGPGEGAWHCETIASNTWDWTCPQHHQGQEVPASEPNACLDPDDAPHRSACDRCGGQFPTIDGALVGLVLTGPKEQRSEGEFLCPNCQGQASPPLDQQPPAEEPAP